MMQNFSLFTVLNCTVLVEIDEIDAFFWSSSYSLSVVQMQGAFWNKFEVATITTAAVF